MIQVCEICGIPADCYVQDFAETGPMADGDLGKWRTWQRDGPPHFFCLNHKRDSRTAFLETTTEADIYFMGQADFDAKVLHQVKMNMMVAK